MLAVVVLCLRFVLVSASRTTDPLIDWHHNALDRPRRSSIWASLNWAPIFSLPCLLRAALLEYIRLGNIVLLSIVWSIGIGRVEYITKSCLTRSIFRDHWWQISFWMSYLAFYCLLAFQLKLDRLIFGFRLDRWTCSVGAANLTLLSIPGVDRVQKLLWFNVRLFV